MLSVTTTTLLVYCASIIAYESTPQFDFPPLPRAFPMQSELGAPIKATDMNISGFYRSYPSAVYGFFLP